MNLRHALPVLALLTTALAPPAAAQWVRQPIPTDAEFYDIVALTDQRLVATGRDGTILQTENGGATWTFRDDTNYYADPFRASFALDSLFVVAATEDGALYKSVDGGLTWALAGELPLRRGDFFVYDLHFRSRTDGWIVGSDFLPPYDDFMWHTTYGGATWTSAFLFEDSRSQLLYVDFEGEKGWTGSDGGMFFRTTDGGQTWTEGSLPDPGVGIDVLDMEFAADGLTGFAGGWDKYLARSTDGGVTWELLEFDIGHIKFSDFHFRSPTDVWASTYFPTDFSLYDDGIVYHSTDGGETATYEEVGADPDAYGSFSGMLVTSNRAYIVGFSGSIYAREVDPVTAPVAVNASPVGGSITIPGSGGSFQFAVTLTNTTAQPQTVQAWTAVDGPVDRSPVFGPKTVTLPAGATITRTLTQQVPANAPQGTYTYAVNVGTFPSTILASDAFTFTKQAGMAPRQDAHAGWQTSGWEETAAPAASSTQPGGFALSEVHPNPFGGAARFTLEVAEAQHVTVEAFDALGRRVATIHDGVLEAGAHTLTFDGVGLPGGLYVVRATGETSTATRRATVVR